MTIKKQQKLYTTGWFTPETNIDPEPIKGDLGSIGSRMVSTNLCPKRVLSYQGVYHIRPFYVYQQSKMVDHTKISTQNQPWPTWCLQLQLPQNQKASVRRFLASQSHGMGSTMVSPRLGWGEACIHLKAFHSRPPGWPPGLCMSKFMHANQWKDIPKIPKNIPQKTAPNWFHQTMTNYTPLKVDGATPKPKYP